MKQYRTTILGATKKVEVGLHAHNNLGCAVASCLAVVSAGATPVDGTLLNGRGALPATRLPNNSRSRCAAGLHTRSISTHTSDSATRSARCFKKPATPRSTSCRAGRSWRARDVPEVLESASKHERSPASFLRAVGEEARKRATLMATTYSDELNDSVIVPPGRNVEPSVAMSRS